MNTTLAPEVTLALLRQCELFSDLDTDSLQFMYKNCAPTYFANQDYLFEAQTKAECFFIIHTGEASVFRREAGNAERELARYLPGDVIGDFDFVMHGTFEAFCKATQDVMAIVFPAKNTNLNNLAKEKPDAIAKIMLRSLYLIASRLRSTQKLIAENTQWVRELRLQSYTDTGTKLMTLAFLNEELLLHLQTPTAFILIKPDKFKELNDIYGHRTGDLVMQQIADILLTITDKLYRGWAIRLRSNETCLVIPHCTPTESQVLATNILTHIKNIVLPVSEVFTGSLSASIVVATYPIDIGHTSTLIPTLQAALRQVWASGGNKIVHVLKQKL